MIKFSKMAGELQRDGKELLLWCPSAQEELSPQMAMAILTAIADPEKPKRKRGRPHGSKNKPKTPPPETPPEEPSQSSSKPATPPDTAPQQTQGDDPATLWSGPPPKTEKPPEPPEKPEPSQSSSTTSEGSNGSLLLAKTCPDKLVKVRKLGDLIAPLFNEAMELGIGEGLDDDSRQAEIAATITERLESWRGQAKILDKKDPEKLPLAVARALVLLAPA